MSGSSYTLTVFDGVPVLDPGGGSGGIGLSWSCTTGTWGILGETEGEEGCRLSFRFDMFGTTRLKSSFPLEGLLEPILPSMVLDLAGLTGLARGEASVLLVADFVGVGILDSL